MNCIDKTNSCEKVNIKQNCLENKGYLGSLKALAESLL